MDITNFDLRQEYCQNAGEIACTQILKDANKLIFSVTIINSDVKALETTRQRSRYTAYSNINPSIVKEDKNLSYSAKDSYGP